MNESSLIVDETPPEVPSREAPEPGPEALATESPVENVGNNPASNSLVPFPPVPERPDWLPQTSDVEERLRRLEAAVAALQDTNTLEEHLIDRIEKKRPPAPVAQIAQTPVAPMAQIAQAPVALVAPPVATVARSQAPSELAMAGRVLLPAAVGMLRAQAELAQSASPGLPAKPAWLFFEMVAEVRAMFWMYFDRRYSVHWGAWLAPVLACVLAFNFWFFLGGSALFGFGHLIEKLIDLPIAYATYKVLQRESQRYRLAVLSSNVVPR